MWRITSNKKRYCNIDTLKWLYNSILRMRVVSDFYINEVSACQVPEYGEIEDYGIVILPSSEEPIAAFSVSDTVVFCQGATFYNESEGSPTEWEWYFQGGTPSTSTELNPTVSYDSEGTYSVELWVKNENGEDEIEKTGYVTVVAGNTVATCTGTTTTPDTGYGIGILEVKVGEASFTSGDTRDDHRDIPGGYLDRVCSHVFTLEQNGSYEASVTVEAFNDEEIAVFLDWNNDGDFEDENEVIARVARIGYN